MTDIVQAMERVSNAIKELDAAKIELASLLSVEPRERKERECSICHAKGHNAKTCPTKEKAAPNGAASVVLA